MKAKDKTKDQLINELVEMRQRIAELDASETQRKRAEDHIQHLQSVLQAIRNVNQLIIHEKNQQRLLQGTCEILNQTRNYKLIWIGLVEEGTKDVLPAAQAGFEEGYLKSMKITWDDSETGKGPTGTAIRTKNPSVMRDIAGDPRYKPWREQAIKRSYASSAAIPLVYENRVFGALNVYATILDSFDEEEIDLLCEVGQDIAFAFHNIELEEERKQAEKALRESDRRFKTILDSMQTGILMIDAETHVIVDGNPAAIAMIRAPKQEIVGHVCHKFICPAEEGKCPITDLGQAVDKSESLLINANRESIPVLKTVALIILGGHRHLVESFLDITERKRAEEELKQSLERLRRTLEGTVHALAATAERRDPYTAGHQQRVTQLACAIAAEMNFPEEQIEGIHMAGLLHDIGKISVPSEILSKPGRISENEFNIIMDHSQFGHDILSRVEFGWPMAQIILQHHERMNGSGYPQGLSGEGILLEARILGVADVVEAMASHRPYRPALGIDKALEEISQKRGVLYDPKVVDACLRLFAERGFKFEEGMKAGTLPNVSRNSRKTESKKSIRVWHRTII